VFIHLFDAEEFIIMVGGPTTVKTLNPSRQYEGKFTSFVFLACIIGSSGGLIFGYDIGISGKT